MILYRHMEQSRIPQFTNPTDSNTFSGMNNQLVIVVLLIILVLSFLGINMFTIVGNLIDSFIKIMRQLINQTLSIFGYGSVDSTEGSLKSDKNVNPDAVSGLDSTLNSGATTYNEPAPSTTENPVQKPIASGKSGWCLVGEYEGKRGCVAVGQQDRCLSGQVFPSQVNCMNPTKA